jgi:AraC-like DNA-binding protein
MHSKSVWWPKVLQFHNQGMSIAEISKNVEASTTIIRWWFKEAGITPHVKEEYRSRLGSIRRPKQKTGKFSHLK